MKWGQEDFSLLIQTLPTFWAERLWILSLVFYLLDPKFLDFQISRFPDAAGAGAGRILRSQLDPSPNAPRDQIRRKEPLLRSSQRISLAQKIINHAPCIILVIHRLDLAGLHS